MLLAVMLLYVGAVLVVNGIWLIGQTRDEASALYIQGREVAVLNVFTGFVGIATATTLLVQGNRDGELATVRGGALILLFAFTTGALAIIEGIGTAWVFGFLLLWDKISF